MSYELSALAKITTDYVNTTDRHIFLTGKAGTGKTTLLKHIVAHTHKKTVVAAPTGIAAINADGVTLHSLLQLPFGAFIPERIQPPDINAQVTTLFNLFTNLRFNTSKRNLIREVELLIIDEVSMLRADLLDCIDHMLRFLRKKKHIPFGGLQVLFIGDLLQLPPVVKDTEWAILSQYYKSSYFFEARALKQQPPIHVELDKVYRQSDQTFIALLNRYRENKQTPGDLDFLNKRYRQDYEKLSDQGFIHLTTHNRKADSINQKRLDNLSGVSYSYTAKIEGDYPEHIYPTALDLELKEGAQVMFIKNDLSEEKRFFNGRIGHVSELNKNKILVTFEDGEVVEAPLHKWENKRYSLNKETNEIEEKILGSFEQYPLKHAWAVTVHKSQGLTFEKAILDLSGAFTQGQVYVALSRLTSLEGLVLSSKIPLDGFSLSDSMRSFVASKDNVDSLAQQLDHERKAYLTRLTSNSFDLTELMTSLRVHEHSFNKQENRSLKQRYHQWTRDLLAEVLPMKEVSDGFVRQVHKITSGEGDYLPLLTERVAKATAYFTPLLTKLSKDLINHEMNLKDKSKLKTYRKELKELEQAVFIKTEVLRKANMLLQFASESKVLTKEDLKPSERANFQKGGNRKSGAKKTDKTPTAEISFNLYKAGKSIEEIAKERGLVNSTIEGHLSQYIQKGELDPLELIDEQMLANIMSLITPEISGLNEVKAKLGDEYTYAHVKIAMAWYKFKNPVDSTD